MDDYLETLEAELKAIELWDRNFCREKTHNEIDEVAYRTRQERRLEISRELEVLQIGLVLDSFCRSRWLIMAVRELVLRRHFSC